MTESQKDIKRMSVSEFRKLGYLQELNRQFLHPLGLALEIFIMDDGEERFGQVWDYRDDPEGMIFGPGLIDPTRAKRIEEETEEKKVIRERNLGWVVQPYE